ncbi:hypothetical protein GGX14DRAFT_450837, partial [Mycena pura]
MDSESQPLLADMEDNHAPVVPSRSDAARSEPQHICARCSSELDLRRGYEPGVDVYLRIALIFAAIVLCIAIFIFAVLLVAARRFHASQVVAAIWADVTIAVLAILVYAGRHRKSHHAGHKLGRTTTQIHVLCGLAVSWTVLTVGLIVQNSRACAHDRTGCGLFTTAHVLAWFLIITCKH